MRCNFAQVKAFYFYECIMGEETVWKGPGAVQSLVFLAEYDQILPVVYCLHS